MSNKTAEKPKTKAGFYWKPSIGKQVAKKKILDMTACAAIRGLGRAGFSIYQAQKIAFQAGAVLNDRTITSHIRLGKAGDASYGAVPTLSNKQIAEAVKIAGKPGSKQEKEVKSATSSSRKPAESGERSKGKTARRKKESAKDPEVSPETPVEVQNTEQASQEVETESEVYKVRHATA